MLAVLEIINYALIDYLSIEFKKGLNIITGETGAGKSIIIGALSLALGQRSNKDAIRQGCDKLVVQAVFQNEQENVVLNEFFEAKGIPIDDENIILTREVFKNGRNICRINGNIVNVNTLKKVGLILVDIHGQHEHQSLLNQDNHLDILDNYGREEIFEIKTEVANLYKNYISIKKEYTELLKNEQYLEREKDLLEYQIKEINNSNLSLGEDVELEKRKKILNNSQKLFDYSNSVYELLYSAEKNSAYDNLSKSISYITKLSNIDDSFKEMLKTMEEFLVVIEDAGNFFRDYKNNIEYNPSELNEIETRLNQINQLKRKYGISINDILHYQNEISNKYNFIINRDKSISELEEQLLNNKNTYLKKCELLSKKRRILSKKFEKKIIEQLKQLAMPKIDFQVNILTETNENKLREKGIDTIEFLISPNLGQELKPLAKIASGGEISRIMLAFKTILADIDNIETFIFDEIDTGISGATAQIVAEKMVKVSNNHQILCITHLPQIASNADVHFNVSKEIRENETYTKFILLNKRQRQNELARMLSGTEVTKLTLSHAEEMIKIADINKSQIRLTK